MSDPASPTGNLCSHPLPTAPVLNLTVDFLFLQPLHHAGGSGSTEQRRGCRWARQKSVSWLETAGAGCGKLGQHGGTASTFPASPEAASELLAEAPMPEEQTAVTAWGQEWREQSPGSRSVPEQGIAAPQTPQLNPGTDGLLTPHGPCQLLTCAFWGGSPAHGTGGSVRAFSGADCTRLSPCHSQPRHGCDPRALTRPGPAQSLSKSGVTPFLSIPPRSLPLFPNYWAAHPTIKLSCFPPCLPSCLPTCLQVCPGCCWLPKHLPGHRECGSILKPGDHFLLTQSPDSLGERGGWGPSISSQWRSFCFSCSDP